MDGELSTTSRHDVQLESTLLGVNGLIACFEKGYFADGKPYPNWEGPYKITKLVGQGTYYLEDLEDKQVPRPWNSNNLKNFC